MFIKQFILLIIVIQTQSDDKTAIKQLLSTNCLFYGCQCSYNLIKCPIENQTKLEMFPKRHFLTVTNQNRLIFDLSNNLLQSIPDDRFAFLYFNKIILSNNRLIRLSPDTFRDIYKLEHLDLSFNLIDYLSFDTLKPVANYLLQLNMEYNSLINMETSRLSTILNSLKKLTKLDISNNKLIYLPNMSTMMLNHLNLASNNLEFLTDSDSNKQLLPNTLTTLNLMHNDLKHLNENSFGKLTKLEYLNLAHNQISEIAEDTFIHLTSLIELNLSFNCLKHIPSRIFFTLINLDHLNLASQKIPLYLIDNYAFDRKTNQRAISSINLSNNHIETVQNRAFCSKNQLNPFVNIKEIDLSNNLLTSLDVCVVRQLSIGYKQSKVAIKTTTATNQTVLNCDCDLKQLVDLNGNCKQEEQIFNFNDLNCNNSFNFINSKCSGLLQFECFIQHKITKPFLIYLKQPSSINMTLASNYTNKIFKQNAPVSDSILDKKVSFNSTGLMNGSVILSCEMDFIVILGVLFYFINAF